MIEAHELREKISCPGWLIFDVRHDLINHQAGRQAYEQGHIPGALYLDHERQLSAPKTGRNGRHPLPARTDFAAFMRTQGLSPQSQVVIYDGGNSMFAAHLWWMLRWLGHEKILVLDGGWSAWVGAAGPIEKGINLPKAFEAQALPDASYPDQAAMPTVDAQAVLENIDKPRFTVIDARATERFRGEVEPMDPVAGHIPAALNYPSSLNLQENGRFRSPMELRRHFETLLHGVAPERVVHQCGSGITACHNLFAMELAGLSGSALYPGSWSEWCSDPARPVARS
nr:sulfurtransferase [Candidimonas sp. SYP-B2681]